MPAISMTSEEFFKRWRERSAFAFLPTFEGTHRQDGIDRFVGEFYWSGESGRELQVAIAKMKDGAWSVLEDDSEPANSGRRSGYWGGYKTPDEIFDHLAFCYPIPRETFVREFGLECLHMVLEGPKLDVAGVCTKCGRLIAT